MELNKGQEEAVKIIVDRYRKGLRYAVLAGPAGTGKTSTVSAIIAAMGDVDPLYDVVYCAYTGKACEVLKKKGNKNTSTLHKLLYQSYMEKDGTYRRIKVEHIPYKVAVIDEASMIDTEMIELLASHKNMFCLFLGDNAQLPPVKASANNGLLDNPHYTLTQIMRQEEGGEIIDFATKIRLGQSIPFFTGENVMILPNGSLTNGMLLWADIILCATNKTRLELNKRVRTLKGFEAPLEVGDKLICTHNNWDAFGSEGSPLMNGQIVYVDSEMREFPGIIPPRARVKGAIPFYTGNIITDTDEYFYNTKIDKSMLINEAPAITSEDRYKIMKNRYGFILPDQFAYAQAITVHKAQGSEFSKVLIIEEKFPFSKDEHQRWLYTAFTRAQDRVVLIRA